jgi:hypothetical protein
MKFLATFCLALSVAAAAPPATEQRVHCNLSALSSADRDRDRQLIPVLRDALQERKELTDGYAYRFPAALVEKVGAWVAIEAKCCQPLTYTLALEPQPGGALWVQITGHDAKEFIDAEFAPLMTKLAASGATR